MKTILRLLLFVFLLTGCDKETNNNDEIAWDEATDGELSGNMSQPTNVNFSLGNNRIIATSVPGTVAMCTTFEGGPPAPVIPFFPDHESYTDIFSFTVPSGSELTGIIVERLEVEAVHSVEDYPCVGPLENQAGAFTAINNSNQVDWNSDSVIAFISLPVNHPLIGMGFAKAEGDDLLAKYRQDFPQPGYEGINSPDLTVGPGNYTFWWKEGANRASYTLNFVITNN